MQWVSKRYGLSIPSSVQGATFLARKDFCWDVCMITGRGMWFIHARYSFINQLSEFAPRSLCIRFGYKGSRCLRCHSRCRHSQSQYSKVVYDDKNVLKSIFRHFKKSRHIISRRFIVGILTKGPLAFAWDFFSNIYRAISSSSWSLNLHTSSY